MTSHVSDIDGSPVKGWCPGALKPMRSGDGLVVRVRTGPIVSRDLARALAKLSRTHGNGQIDLTQRANLQLRGVTDKSWPELIAVLSDLGVLDEDAGVEAVRNIIVSPLARLDPSAMFDGLAAWHALNDCILADPVFRQLPGKFGFLIDDGGALPLVDATTDVHFRGTPEGVVVEIGGRIGLAVISADEIPEVAARLAATFLALKGETRRLTAMAGVIGTEAIRAYAGLADRVLPEPDARAPRDVVGPQSTGEADVIGVGIPFGRMSADMLDALADSAAEIRLTPWRAVMLTGDVDVSRLDAARFILSPDDPRLAIAACPGAPECESAARAIRGDALTLAPLAAKLAGNGVKLHVSGCVKGCARPEKTAVTLVARQNGYDLIENGRTSADPISTGLALGPIEAYLEARTAGQKRP
jgi:precorrin-3B synthase